MTRLATFVSLLLAAGCAQTDIPVPDRAPGAPSKADEAGFTIEGLRRWYLIGNPLTPGDDSLEVSIESAEPVEVIDLWLDRQFAARGHASGGRVEIVVDIGSLATGEHEILLAADGAEFAFAQRFFRRSHPLYVVVSNDWDDPDNDDATLERQERLHARHPSLLLTHFVGPYTFTDSSVSAARRDFLVDWVTGLRDSEGDEIGLHIHPYCNFIDTTGVECRTEPSTVYDAGDETGYTVMCSAYSEQEFTDILLAADAVFEENGLGKPTSFRAGGWTAELGTLRALAAAGYLADGSALNWARLEEWEGQQNGVLYQWNREHWASIGDTSQPYYPSDSDILLASEPSVPVLEVPDNGILVDYVTGDEMIEIFDANWDRETPLAQPLVYSIGYHPPNFISEYRVRITEALTHAEQFLASQGAGPVVYATMSEMAEVWPRPQ